MSQVEARLSPPLTEKICTGPSHPEPVLLPASEFYVRRSKGREGELVSRCKRCVNYGKVQSHRNHGTIPAERVQPLVQEMINRVGQAEAIRMSGISQGTLTAILDGKTQAVQKETARKVIETLKFQRQNGLVYHRKDIEAGIDRKRKNGVKLRRVRRPSEQYGPVFPELEAEQRAYEAQMKRESRARRTAEQIEQDRLKERQRWAVRKALKLQRKLEDNADRLTGY